MKKLTTLIKTAALAAVILMFVGCPEPNVPDIPDEPGEPERIESHGTNEDGSSWRRWHNRNNGLEQEQLISADGEEKMLYYLYISPDSSVLAFIDTSWQKNGVSFREFKELDDDGRYNNRLYENDVLGSIESWKPVGGEPFMYQLEEFDGTVHVVTKWNDDGKLLERNTYVKDSASVETTVAYDHREYDSDGNPTKKKTKTTEADGTLHSKEYIYVGGDDPEKEFYLKKHEIMNSTQSDRLKEIVYPDPDDTSRGKTLISREPTQNGRKAYLKEEYNPDNKTVKNRDYQEWHADGETVKIHRVIEDGILVTDEVYDEDGNPISNDL